MESLNHSQESENREYMAIGDKSLTSREPQQQQSNPSLDHTAARLVKMTLTPHRNHFDKYME